MSGFTRVNGDAQPVFAIDTQNGPIAPATLATGNGITTNFIGPALDFFAIDVKADPAAELGVGEMVSLLMTNIAQMATVMMYQVSVTNTRVSVAVYPIGAYTAGTLQTQVQAMGATVGPNNFDLSTATVTNVGFKLAIS